MSALPRVFGVHKEKIHTGKPARVPSDYARIRKATMKACPCKLCYLAINPPMTFADAEALGAPGKVWFPEWVTKGETIVVGTEVKILRAVGGKV